MRSRGMIQLSLVTGLILALTSSLSIGQSSMLGIRIGKVRLGSNEIVKLEGPPVLFSLFHSDEAKRNYRDFVIGVTFERIQKYDFIQRANIQFGFSYSFGSKVWKVPNSELVTLDFSSTMHSLSCSYSAARCWTGSWFRFAMGFDTGLAYTPNYDQSEFYEFVDSSLITTKSYSIFSSYPGILSPYCQLLAAFHYRISKRMLIGFEFLYGISASFVNGYVTVDGKEFDAGGNLVSAGRNSLANKSFTLSLPNRIDLPLLSVMIQLGN